MSPEILPADLAPGDRRAAGFDFSAVRVNLLRSADDRLFDRCYARLENEFGPRGEMEQRAVIESRLQWDPARPVGERALLYEMIAVESGDELVAVRDHTAILAPGDSATSAVVHLSHVWVEPAWRGSGLAAWLRAWPLQAARRCAERAGRPAPTAVTLVAEMEAPEIDDGSKMARLRAYQRAGFGKLDPAVVPYCQPDFRDPAVIDADAVRPVPLVLIVRRLGLEYETHVSGDEVCAIGSALYSMYATSARPDHMRPLWEALDRYPAPEAKVALLEPTA